MVFLLIIILLLNPVYYTKAFDVSSLNPGGGQGYIIGGSGISGFSASEGATNLINLQDSYSTDLYTGTAVYSYPVVVPPGINGLKPNVVLYYSHRGGNGFPSEAGTGWSLGLDSISRIINYTRSNTSDDYFVLSLLGSNEKLIYVSGESRYHTEHESFRYIKEYSNGTNQNHDYWMITTRDGTQYRFGFYNSSEQVSNLESFTTKWMLDQIQDINGNQVNFTYAKNPNSENGTIYISKIDYGLNSIQFTYNYTRYQPMLHYENGNNVFGSGLITDISVLNNNTLVRRYTLGYNINLNKPYLKDITYVGSDNTTTLPPVTFTYQGFGNSYTETAPWQLPQDTYLFGSVDEGFRIIDVNGDGLPDIVKANNSVQKVWYNNGSGFYSPTNLANFVPGGITDFEGHDLGVRFLDMDGDSRIDVLKKVIGDSNFSLAKRNNGSGWVNISISLPVNSTLVKKNSSSSCIPPYIPQLDCEPTTTCNSTSCSRVCMNVTCLASINSTNTHNNQLSWNDNRYKRSKVSTYFPVPSKSKLCYQFEIATLPTKPCYDLETTAGSCNGNDIDAYAAIGFRVNTGNSWLQTMPSNSNTGYIPYAYNDGWSGGFLSDTRYDSSPNEDGDWVGLDGALCINHYIVKCAPGPNSCASWDKNNCGYGCDGQSTASFASIGLYINEYGNIRDALVDNYECQNQVTDNNDYFDNGYEPSYQVIAYNSLVAYKNSTCTFYEMQDRGVRLADVNGDGKTDIVEGNTLERKTWLGKGSQFIEDSIWQLPPNAYFVEATGNNNGVETIDVNGDGMPDIVQAVNDTRITWINNGKGWVNSSIYLVPANASIIKDNGPQGVMFVDLNNDGMIDILKSKDYWNTVWINNGTGWQETAWTFPQILAFNDPSNSIIDINGDGASDIVRAYGTDKKTWISGDANTNLLSQITTSQGGTISINYMAASSLNNLGNDTIADLANGGLVVNSVIMDNGLGSQVNYTYNYSGGYFDPEDKEFRGFNVAEEKFEDGKLVRHYFLQDKAKRGMQYKTEVYDGNGNIFTKSETIYSTQLTNGYYTAYPTSSKQTSYEGNMQSGKSTWIEFTYDSYGNVIATNSLGDNSTTGDERYGYSEYVYNTNTWILGKPKRTYLYDSNNSTKLSETFYYYDNQAYGATPIKGLPTKQEFWLSGGTNPTKQYSYNSFGNLISETDPLGRVSNYTYDQSNVFITKTRNPAGQEVNLVYDIGTGNLISQIDSNGITTSFEYDVLGRKTKDVRVYDNSTYPSTLYLYENDGIAPESSITSAREQPLSSNTYDSYSFSDGMGRAIVTRAESENNMQLVNYILYDKNNRVSFQSNPYFNNYSNNSVSLVPINGINFTYDALDRAVKILNPDGTFKTVNFSSWNKTAYDENGNKKQYITDAYGRIKEIYEFNNNDAYKTSYKYDSRDNLIQINDSLGNTINFTYDSLGRKTRMEDPDLGIWTYSYDAAGNLVTQIDGRGSTTSLSYDSLNRAIKKNTTDEIFIYTYDLKKNGTLSKTSFSLGYTNYTYDDRLRVVSKVEVYDGFTFVTNYTYDAMDRAISVRKPDGTVVNYYYGSNGMLSQVGSVLTNITYNELGLPKARAYGSGVVSEFNYSPDSMRLSQIKTGSIQEIHYEYDNTGNLLELDDTANSREYTMTYDSLSRLKTAERKDGGILNPNFNFTYYYKANGNIEEVHLGKGEKLTYTYSSKPVHAPSSILYETPNVIITNISEFTSNGNDEVIRFIILNNGSRTADNIVWAYNSSENLINNSDLPLSIEKGKRAVVIVDRVYSKPDVYQVSVNLNGLFYYLNASVGKLVVKNLQILNSTNKNRVFRFMVKDIDYSLSNNVTVIFNTGETNITQSNITLDPSQRLFVYIDYNYTNAGSYTAKAYSSYLSFNDSLTIPVQVS